MRSVSGIPSLGSVAAMLPFYDAKLKAEEEATLKRRPDFTVQRSADSVDQTVLDGEREQASRLEDSRWKRLRDIAQARKRIVDGTFGICQGCEDLIAEHRLKLMPWAKFCVTCQAMAEGIRS